MSLQMHIFLQPKDEREILEQIYEKRSDNINLNTPDEIAEYPSFIRLGEV